MVIVMRFASFLAKDNAHSLAFVMFHTDSFWLSPLLPIRNVIVDEWVGRGQKRRSNMITAHTQHRYATTHSVQCTTTQSEVDFLKSSEMIFVGVTGLAYPTKHLLYMRRGARATCLGALRAEENRCRSAGTPELDNCKSIDSDSTAACCT